LASDGDLVRRARTGDEPAFRELCRRHSAALLEAIRRAGARAPDEVLTEAFVLASRRLREFEDGGEGSFGRWLLGIVEERLRAGAKGPAALAAEMQEASREALAKLPPSQREVLRLLQDERLPVEDAAIRMGRTPDAVRRLYERALRRFAELIRKGKRGGG
jgi:DNA-directed RNA polymerase specialized sigma24 family protein